MTRAGEQVKYQSYLPGLWTHTWSLAVEEHFYLLLPLVLVLVLRLNRGSPTPLRPVLALAAGGAVATLALRVLTWVRQPTYSHLTHHFASHLRLDSLFFGVAIAYAYHLHTDAFVGRCFPWRRQLMLGGTLLLAPAFVLRLETTPFVFTVGFTLFYLGSGMLMVGLLLCDLPRSRILVALATLGAYSYSIYLWHVPVGAWVVTLAERAYGATLGFGWRPAMSLIGSLAAGVVMAKVVELPALRLRDHWLPETARVHAVKAAPVSSSGVTA